MILIPDKASLFSVFSLLVQDSGLACGIHSYEDKRKTPDILFSMNFKV